MKKRKHCTTKRHNRIASAVLKDLVLVFVAGADKGVRLMHRRKKVFVPCTSLMADSIANCQFKWSVFCAITLRRQDGQEYMQSEAFNFEQPYRQSFVTEYLNEQHKRLLHETNPAHRVGAGWIACPNGVEISDDEAAEILTKANAWEFLAMWECKDDAA